MHGTYVVVDGHSVFVLCCPDTPKHEIAQRAADQLRKEWEAKRENEIETIRAFYCARPRLLISNRNN